MCERASQPIMGSMNTSVLNYHLATTRAADIERDMQRLLVREPAKRHFGFAFARRDRRAALKVRLIG
jgi:hypothetical protein